MLLYKVCLVGVAQHVHMMQVRPDFCVSFDPYLAESCSEVIGIWNCLGFALNK